MAMRRALITGISGQDGSYLAERLLAEGYEVHGAVRPPLSRSFPLLRTVASSVQIWPCDLRESSRLAELLETLKPDEIYNLAAVTFLGDSWNDPNNCFEINARAVLGFLESVRLKCPAARFFQAGTSEMFGQPLESPQNESTSLRPRSPYGLAKAAAHEAVRFYREKHGLFAVGGIMFNHESPRRGSRFVTRKVTLAAARIRAGLDQELRLGDLTARRDWGHAKDYVAAMTMMLRQDDPRDFVIGTGKLHSVEDFVAIAFAAVDLDWKKHVVIDPAYCRPPEQVQLVADATAIRNTLGWKPEIDFGSLAEEMALHDLHQLSMCP